jgi:polysaccharide export outer membrane protein
MVLLMGVCTLGMAEAQSKGAPDGATGGTPQALPEAPKVSPDAPVANPTVGVGVDPNTFIIGQGDALYVEVFRQPNFTRAVGVRPDGKITMPINIELQAAGLTPNKLAEQLKEALSDQIVNPLVTVTVTQVNSKKYTISGEIGRPGTYPLTEPIHVFDALNNAGGFKDFANKKRVVIVRGTQRLYFNYQDFLRTGKGADKNVVIENGDTIVVN